MAQSSSMQGRACARRKGAPVTGARTGGRGGSVTDATVDGDHPEAAVPSAAAPGATASQVQLTPVVAAEHRAAVAAFRESYAALPAGAPVRLAKRTSNLFRFREAAPRAGGRRGTG